MGATPVTSVYVHAPFCVRRCAYCDFAVQVRREGDVSGWRKAITAELEAVEQEGVFTLAPELDTLYVGGGTPSLLGASAMAALREAVGDSRLRHERLEWTAEANPESLTPEVAAAWRTAGVNRLSLGVQSFDEHALRWMGRLHRAEGSVRAVQVAGDCGFDNLSIDLIFGIPASIGRSWSDDLDRALALEVSHISLYGLSVEPRTPLGRAVAEGREPRMDEEQYREEFLLAAEALSAAGYAHYEVSNFARDGYRSRHNSVYWTEQPYLGLGNGAHSYAHPLRRWNVRDWDEYQRRVMAGEPAEEGRELIDAAAHGLERAWLRLRVREGLATSELGDEARCLTQRWVEDGLAERTHGRVRLTPPGWLLLDSLAVDLDGAIVG